MAKIKIKILLSVIITLIILAFSFLNYQKPTYKGEIAVSGLQNKVEVYFDETGVPHIYAENNLDAYKALGYVHAQDRLWQMELLRRIAAGRLSEMFGEKTLKVDQFFTGLGIEEASKETIENLKKDSETYQLTEAYLEGLNQFIKEGVTPIEYHLVGVEKEFFELKDVYNVYGYMAFSFAMAHKTDPLLSELKHKLGAVYLNELPIEIDSSKTAIIGTPNFKNVASISNSLNSVLEKLPVSSFVGSNSWVLGPEKTVNGKVIFENDPHIGFSQPSVWYQAHIKTPNYECYGFHLGLIPFPMLGHNREYAFGMTMFENDDIDFYQEEVHPTDSSLYRYKETYLPYSVVEKTIKVKEVAPVKILVKNTIHGPVINSLLEGITFETPIAMSWIYTQQENKLLEASYQMSHAHSMSDFEKAASMIHAPGLNLMYGDAKGNIGWWASAKLYKRKNNANPKFVLNGAEGEDDQLSFVDFTKNPQSKNPESNYVYSANNQSFATFYDEGVLKKNGYQGYYLPEDRAKRIVDLLDEKEKFSMEDVKEMTLDVRSTAALEFLSYFNLENLRKERLSSNLSEAIAILVAWDGKFTKESVGATIYMKLYYTFLKKTMEDEMGGHLFKQFLNTHIQKRTSNYLIANEYSVWWDNVLTTSIIETREDILMETLVQTILDLEHQLGDDITDWKWRRVHTLEHKHPIGEVALLRSFFNVGPFDADGGNEVLNNLQYNIDSTGVYKVKAGPSTRRVIDFSDLENSWEILPTGQSGNPFSKHYKDQAEKFVNGDFVKMLLNEKEIKKSEDLLILIQEL
ncbi:penicillin acylase family protein [Flavicella sediminum]|uniref:penicillin acylase family protein n=1 Tax=Flavicella sediminum TaxID=2585141 RepID=UPI001120658C|nr:penicillin acylase family protein [Flavicella sediminum]